MGATGERTLDVVERLLPIAEETGIPMTHLATAFTIARPGVTGVLLGPHPVEYFDASGTSRADPARLGVHAARPGPDGSRQPPCVARGADDDLDRRLRAAASDRRGGMVLVSGGSMAGKSRALAAAPARRLPKRRLVVPPEDADLTHLPAWLKRRRWRGWRG